MEFTKREMELFNQFKTSDQKTSFFIMFNIFTKELKIDYWNRKWNDPNRKWNYVTQFQGSDPKMPFAKWNDPNWIWNYSSFFKVSDKKLILQFFFIFNKEFKINLWNGKWNYSNRKWNYVTNFQTSNRNTFFNIFLFFF